MLSDQWELERRQEKEQRVTQDNMKNALAEVHGKLDTINEVVCDIRRSVEEIKTTIRGASQGQQRNSTIHERDK